MSSRALVVLALFLIACDDESAVGTPQDVTGPDTSASDTTGVADVATDASAPDTLASTSPDTPDTSGTPDTPDTSDTIPEGPIGGARPARVVLPSDYQPAIPVPLVLLLHGYGVPGDIQDAYLGFSAVAARAGFLTIIPDGTVDATGQRFWNADPAWCCNFAHAPVDDVAYLTGLIDEAKTLWTIDATRIYVFGHSNGGFMAHRLACVEADRFAAIASLAGSLPIAVSDCDPSSATSVLQIHGTSDAVIAYAGNADYPGALSIVDRWISYDDCTGDPTTGGPHDYDSAVLGPETSTATWSTCAGGAEVGLWTLTGSSHIPTVSGGDLIADVLTFFARHHKP